MKIILAVILAFSISSLHADGSRFYACGWGNLVEYEVDFDQSEVSEIWSWQPGTYSGVPENFEVLFEKIDECKSVNNGQIVLLTASSSGVGIVNRADQSFSFLGEVGNAHSIDLLPNNRVAVAGSHRDDIGDRLAIFDLSRPGLPLYETELYQGHGVYWDADTEKLWALADAELRIYQLQDWHTESPALELVKSIPLPGPGGHDLSRLPGAAVFSITITDSVWLFDIETEEFVAYPGLHSEKFVKSVDQNPTNGTVLWVKAGNEGWWSNEINIAGDRSWVFNTDRRFYKARWINSD